MGVVYGTAPPVPSLGLGLAPARYRWRMPAEPQIAPVSAAEYEELLPLIAAYQRFYEVDDVDESRNREFFRRFLAPSEVGLLLGARAEGRFLGYACLYWHFSSTQAVETVLMNDLFVYRRGARPGRRPGPDRGQRRRRPRAAAPPTSSGRPPPTTTPPSASTTPPAPSAASGSSTSWDCDSVEPCIDHAIRGKCRTHLSRLWNECRGTRRR